jgi:hypothetical protein
MLNEKSFSDASILCVFCCRTPFPMPFCNFTSFTMNLRNDTVFKNAFSENQAKGEFLSLLFQLGNNIKSIRNGEKLYEAVSGGFCGMKKTQKKVFRVENEFLSSSRSFCTHFSIAVDGVLFPARWSEIRLRFIKCKKGKISPHKVRGRKFCNSFFLPSF